jgi:hypothetical protein
MIEIQIKEDKYEIPTEWKDITLEYWCGLYNIIKKYTETAQGEDEQEIEEPKLDEVKVLRMNRAKPVRFRECKYCCWNYRTNDGRI